jgi:hypothetical protein
MAREIVIDFALGADRASDIGRIRDFGEVLYRQSRDDHWVRSPSVRLIGQLTSSEFRYAQLAASGVSSK